MSNGKNTPRKPPDSAAQKPEAPPKPATSGETAAAIKRFESRYSATLERLAKR